MSESESVYLTKTERKFLAALASADSIKAAAQAIGEDPGTLSNFLYALKRKWKNRRGWLNAILAQKKRSKLLNDKLVLKVGFEAPELEQIDSEEDF